MAKRMQAEEKKMGHCVWRGEDWGLLSSHPQGDGSRFSVDSGRECGVRHDDTATATSLVSGKH
ncbi:unnamed protein product [Tetraodon nigroviridis]|uniref:(spotted green pufferfish) hypothetical protein n=1 Tax=Tetraodon nigroviridis TaxID=99883 RepID=Q4S149_TETNG|nr:unnamed protein product [Tetraodon nigroviridis]